MSEKANRFRRQGVQLICGGAIDLAVAIALFLLLTSPRSGGGLAALGYLVAVAIAALGAFMMIGGSVLLITADRPLFSGRRSAGG